MRSASVSAWHHSGLASPLLPRQIRGTQFILWLALFGSALDPSKWILYTIPEIWKGTRREKNVVLDQVAALRRESFSHLQATETPPLI